MLLGKVDAHNSLYNAEQLLILWMSQSSWPTRKVAQGSRGEVNCV